MLVPVPAFISQERNLSPREQMGTQPKVTELGPESRFPSSQSHPFITNLRFWMPHRYKALCWAQKRINVPCFPEFTLENGRNRERDMCDSSSSTVTPPYPLAFIGHLLYIRHYAYCFTHINSFHGTLAQQGSAILLMGKLRLGKVN